jgi:DNA-binding NarL/FixJ family response regulator
MNAETAPRGSTLPGPGLEGRSPSSRDTHAAVDRDEHLLVDATRSWESSSIADSKISVIVVAAEKLFRLGLAGLLSEDDRLDVIEVSDGEPELLGLCRATAVDVVLIDLELSRADAIEVVRSLALECPTTKTLVLTSNADWRVRPAMIAGAAGLLLKDTSPEAIRAAVVSVHLGDQVFCNEAARWMLGEEPTVHLTQRESDVLRMVAQGANNTEIASELHLGQKTVRNYVSRLYRKLDLSNRTQVATYLAQTGITYQAGVTDPVQAESDYSVQGQ